MSDFTPSTSNAQSYYVAGRAQLRRQVTGEQAIDITPYSHEFDRFLAEVERAAARKALWEAANRHQEQFGERVCELTLSTPTSRWLRAEACRREENGEYVG